MASGTSCSSSGSSRASRPRSAATRRRASLETARRTARTASTIGSNGTIASAVARPHRTTAPTACTSAAKCGGQAGLAGARPRPAAARCGCAPADVGRPHPPQDVELLVAPDELAAARWRAAAGPGSGTGDGPGGAGRRRPPARTSARSATAAAGGVHVLAGDGQVADRG